ncbi:hypothetical protein [Runella sp.]|uniref:hypothetical protein n=1 Tax=Runella sp. TaxID=1960881 RepID=UPI003D0A539E
MAEKYTVTVPEGGARHALPGMGLISIREDMPDHLIEVFIENGVTQYFEEKADTVEPETNKADEQIQDSAAAVDTKEAGATATPNGQPRRRNS